MSEASEARRFDGRVAVITGAGRGLGRAYAELLAGLGAKVLVNDIGAAIAGGGSDASPAEETVAAIRAAGGEAEANFDTVATMAGGRAIAEAAMDHFGAIDIMIHNAGNTLHAPLEDMTYDQFRAVVDVHLLGAFHVVQPAYREMHRRGYGRVVLTGSIGGLYSIAHGMPYAVSKSGVIGFSNVVAIEGAARNIKSNIILPGAVTRMSEGIDTSQFPPMGPALVAPVVGWLAHESCTITGEMLVSVAGRVARAFVTETRGVFQPEWTIGQVGARIGEIRDEGERWTFQPIEGGFMQHLQDSFAMTRAG